MQVQENVPLAPLTTIRIGGPARFFFRACSVDDVLEALEWARQREHPVFFLGGGSNLLISDAGFPGLVIQLDLRGITVASETAG
jgi:UDP-N-acetylmuramate dehydrogenase